MDEIIQNLVRKHKTNDPFQIAESRNVLIRFTEFDSGTRGLYFQKLRRRFIVIDSNLSDDWQRIVCAHELAHDCLHPGVSHFWIDDRTFFNIGKFERQANTFAVKLLTHSVEADIGESKEHFLLRCRIPRELHHFV